MNSASCKIASSPNHNNVYFIFRDDGSEIKVFVSHTNQNYKHYYEIGEHYLISPVVLTDVEISCLQNSLLQVA